MYVHDSIMYVHDNIVYVHDIIMYVHDNYNMYVHVKGTVTVGYIFVYCRFISLFAKIQ